VKAIVAEERVSCVAIAKGAGKAENAEAGRQKRLDTMIVWILVDPRDGMLCSSLSPGEEKQWLVVFVIESWDDRIYVLE